MTKLGEKSVVNLQTIFFFKSVFSSLFFYHFVKSLGLQMLHCSIPNWFLWISRSEEHFTFFNSGRQLSMSTSKPLKTVLSNSLKQSPFLVGTMSDSSLGFQYDLIDRKNHCSVFYYRHTHTHNHCLKSVHKNWYKIGASNLCVSLVSLE